MPVKGMLIQDYQDIKIETYGWIHSVENGTVNFEIRDKYYKIPLKYVVEVPVPSPSLNDLALKDSCFKMPLAKGFELMIHEDNQMYEIYRCQKHGRYFLLDTRGTSMVYGRFVLVEESDTADFESIYQKYHHISDDMLNYLKIAR
jgi:hypothetical protein